jgi:hypothetical protein
MLIQLLLAMLIQLLQTLLQLHSYSIHDNAKLATPVLIVNANASTVLVNCIVAANSAKLLLQRLIQLLLLMLPALPVNATPALTVKKCQSSS